METQEFLNILEARFAAHRERHERAIWQEVREAILASGKIDILTRMEETGGEVDLVKETEGRYMFFDCSAESPEGRRSVCYDEAALAARKEPKPQSSAEQLASLIGADLLNETDYLFLQSLGDFDLKSQSWLATDQEFREKGDALFGNKRHGRTFVYYNGAQSYYRSRGFRCKLEIEKPLIKANS